MSNSENMSYWHLIRWNAVGYLTLHDGIQSRLFHGKEKSNALVDTARFIRGLLGGLIRFSAQVTKTLITSRVDRKLPVPLDFLLITVGTSKYAGEESEILQACARRGLGVYVLHLWPGVEVRVGEEVIPLETILSPVDQVLAQFEWLGEVMRTASTLFSPDAKQRALYAVSLSDIRNSIRNEAYTRRLFDSCGCPKGVLSLCPAHAASNAIVDYARRRSVVTAGMRTQTTSKEIEHRAINTDILFFKGLHEGRVYRDLFENQGPKLLPGCVLSVPARQALAPAALPREYALLLGTAPATGQDKDQYLRYVERLFEVAESLSLPAVFKGHNLARRLDEEWRARAPRSAREALMVDDAARNRELIDKASIVVSASSTLLYYAILREKPVILLESDFNGQYEDEFSDSPITRIRWQDDVPAHALDLTKLRESVTRTSSWFKRMYFLDRSADHVIAQLLDRGFEIGGDLEDDRVLHQEYDQGEQL